MPYREMWVRAGRGARARGGEACAASASSWKTASLWGAIGQQCQSLSGSEPSGTMQTDSMQSTPHASQAGTALELGKRKPKLRNQLAISYFQQRSRFLATDRQLRAVLRAVLSDTCLPEAKVQLQLAGHSAARQDAAYEATELLSTQIAGVLPTLGVRQGAEKTVCHGATIAAGCPHSVPLRVSQRIHKLWKDTVEHGICVLGSPRTLRARCCAPLVFHCASGRCAA